MELSKNAIKELKNRIFHFSDQDLAVLQHKTATASEIMNMRRRWIKEAHEEHQEAYEKGYHAAIEDMKILIKGKEAEA